MKRKHRGDHGSIDRSGMASHRGGGPGHVGMSGQYHTMLKRTGRKGHRGKRSSYR